MTYEGTVQNGVIVLAHGQFLPEGAVVQITPRILPEKAEDAKPIGQVLAELAEWAETQPCDLPSDLAINHDHYLYGVPKRE
jgi:hypothetical protein